MRPEAGRNRCSEKVFYYASGIWFDTQIYLRSPSSPTLKLQVEMTTNNQPFKFSLLLNFKVDDYANLS